MLEIQLNRKIVCDNGKKYIVCHAYYPFKYSLYESEEFDRVNEVKEYYLENAIKLKQLICVGRNNKKLEYTYIVGVEKSREEMRDDEIIENLNFLNVSTERQNELMIEIREARNQSNRKYNI